MTTSLENYGVCVETAQDPILVAGSFMRVGMGMPGHHCGKWCITHRSDEWNAVRYGYHGCNDPECEICALKVIRRTVEGYLPRVHGYAVTHRSIIKNFEVRVEGGVIGRTWNEIQRGLRKKGRAMLKRSGVVSLFQFFHPFEDNGEYDPHFHVVGCGEVVETAGDIIIHEVGSASNVSEYADMIQDLLMLSGKRRGTNDRLSGPCGALSGPTPWRLPEGPAYSEIMRETAQALGKVYDEIMDRLRWPSHFIPTAVEGENPPVEPRWVSIKTLQRDIRWARATDDPYYLANQEWWDYLAAVQAGHVEGKNPLLLFQELEPDGEVAPYATT